MSDKKENRAELPYRFPGVASFDDDTVAHALFFGRDDEAQRLLYNLLSENLTVLFSYSGYGKTSLLRAKVFPALREKNYFPVVIRFNEKGIEPVLLVKQKVLEGALKAGYTIGPNKYLGFRKVSDFGELMEKNLFTFFKTMEIWSTDYKLITPVLVFDQFEEIFTLEHNNQYREKFFHELSMLVNPSGEGRLSLRILLSIREDLIGRLENLSEHIPSVFTNRFQLEALTRDNAEKAIGEPAAKKIEEVNFASSPFAFSAGAMKVLLDFLISRKAEGTDRSKGYVEPVQLQVICRELEERVILGMKKDPAGVKNAIVKNKDGKIVVTEQDLGGEKGLDEMIGNFYQKQLTRLETELKLSLKEVQAVRNVIEKELIVGGRRVPVAYDAMITKPDVRKDAVDLLMREKLLRGETSHSGSDMVELSHDTLVKPILRFYEERRLLEENKRLQEEEEARKKKTRKRLTYGAVAMIVLAFGFLWVKKLVAEKAANSAEQEKYLTAATKAENKNSTLAYIIAVKGKAIDPSDPRFDSLLYKIESNRGWLTQELQTEGTVIAAGCTGSNVIAVDDHAVYTWDENGILLKKQAFAQQIECADVFPDGKVLAYTFSGGDQFDTIHVYNQDGKVKQNFLLPAGKESSPLAIAEDGKWLLSGNSIYQMGKATPVCTIREEPSYYYSKASISNGKLIFWDDAKQFDVYNLNDALLKDTLTPKKIRYHGKVIEDVSSAAMIGSTLLVLSSDGTLFSASEDGVFSKFGAHEKIHAFSVSQNRVMVACEEGSYVSDAEGRQLAFLKQTMMPSLAAFGQNYIVASDRRLMVWFEGKPGDHKLATYSPYDYKLLGLTGPGFNAQHIYNPDNFNSLLAACINYGQRIAINATGEKSVEESALLPASFYEADTLYQRLFHDPGFVNGMPQVQKIYTLQNYSSFIRNVSERVIPAEDTIQILVWKARADSVDYEVLMSQGINDYNAVVDLSYRLRNDGAEFYDRRMYERAKQCYLFSYQIAMRYSEQYPKHALILGIREGATGLANCYKQEKNVGESRAVLFKTTSLIEALWADSAITSYTAFRNLTVLATFYRDSLNDYDAAIRILNHEEKLVDKKDNSEYSSFLVDKSITFLYWGKNDSAAYFADKAQQVDKTSDGSIVKTCVLLATNKAADAKKQFDNGASSSDNNHYYYLTTKKYVDQLQQRRPPTEALTNFNKKLDEKMKPSLFPDR